jgi:N-acetylneuraminic acid mutarotase
MTEMIPSVDDYSDLSADYGDIKEFLKTAIDRIEILNRIILSEEGIMNNKFVVCLVLLLAFGFTQKNLVKKSDAVRQSPRLLNYQGYLTDTLGNPITNSSVSMIFAIYDATTTGNQKWTETQSAVSVNNGIFNVLLGSVTPIPDSVFTASTFRWLELSVDGQTLAPRTRITTAGYAYTATYSDTALYAKSAIPDTDWVIMDSTMHSGIIGKVGIGAANPSEKFEVSGNLKVSGSGNGLIFPDATKQTTAATGGVPQGYCILGPTTIPPIGYIYTGHYINSENQDEQWQTRADMPTARQFLAAVEVNGKIYALGGYNGTPLHTNEEYDPVTNTWQSRADMPTARFYLAAVAVNGKIYALGGANGTNLQTNEEYDPVTNTWRTRADMPTTRFSFAAAAVNGKIYVLGGDHYGFLNINEEYDPVTNTWRTRADMPTARYGLAAAAVNGKIYALGGNIVLQTNEEYDPENNTWQSRADMPTARSELVASVVNNKIYAIAGDDGMGGWLRTNEEYNPATNTWQTRTSIPTVRIGLEAASANGKIYTLGGNNGSIFVPTNETYQPVVVPSPFYIYMKY